MDISVLASVGSFVMSEKVLKPKASVLTILGCLLAYDLTTKTHDSSSLRIYRGPALFAFTFMMCALSLRTWRRNGVACDELLFLPGTEHGALHGVDHENHTINTAANTQNVHRGNSGSSAPNLPEDPPASLVPAASATANEGDVAAGGPSTMELVPLETKTTTRNMQRGRRGTEDSISFVDSWDIDDDEEHPEVIDEQNEEEGEDAEEDDEFDEENDKDDMASLLAATSSSPQQVRRTASQRGNSTSDERRSRSGGTGPVHRFRENHPRITRIGSFFFFRSSTSSTQNAAYAPSGPSVLGAALDLSMPILFNFHLFIDAYNHIEAYGSEAPAKILPLIFLSVLIVRSFIPPGRRGHFWSTMKFTFMAPFHRVRFRDAFIGDLLTSLVRPLQDVLFALSYYVTVIYGTATGKFGLSVSSTILEQSWLLHNVVLPSAALLPLWWKFLQTLRQCYDTGNRWPHLGNAFKYLSAALVVLYGMTHPEDRRSSWWLVFFFFTLSYQVAWDVFVDWDLIEIAPRTDDSVHLENSWFSSASSYRANSFILSLRMQLYQPLSWILAKVPRLGQIQLRSRRLYKSESFYWRILFYNVVFRFTWMLCFIPAYRMSASGEEHVTTFSSDTNSYVGVLLPVAEILRRTLWGFLMLENKTIQLQDADPNFAVVHRMNSRDSMVLEPSEEHSDPDVSKSRHLPNWLGASQSLPLTDGAPLSWWQRTSESLVISEELRAQLFVAELSLWAFAFIGLGLWATA